MASFASIREHTYDREERRQYYGAHLMGLNAYDRHKKFMNDYARYYGKGSTVDWQKLPIKTDQDTLRETYRFIRTEEDDLESSWEQQLAKRYHDKLFKEYCIADMTNYKVGKIGLRWRVEKEVISGKGQFLCGNKNCDEREGLSSYEVNFSYKEAGQCKQALVKLRVCPRCAKKLNYRRDRERDRLSEIEENEDRKRRRDEGSYGKLKGKMHSPPATVALSKEQETSRTWQRVQSSESEDAGRGQSGPQGIPAQASTSPEEDDNYFAGLFL